MTAAWRERLFAPEWAGGWVLTRWLYAVASLTLHLPRYDQIVDAQAHPEVVFTSGPFRVADTLVLSYPASVALWSAGLVGLGALARGGRLARSGLGLWLVTAWPLVMWGGLSARVPERLFLLVGLVLLLAPLHDERPGPRRHHGLPRWLLLVLACALYGSTGWLKALTEPAWWTGEALAYDLVDRYFGVRPVGVWLSARPGWTRALSLYTIAVEASLPLLIWWRRSNPWILAAAAGLHLGIEVAMDVGPLTWCTLAMYPVLLHPEVAERLWRRLGAWTSRSGSAR